MPLNDGFQSEKQLSEAARQIAPALDDALDMVEKQRYSFLLFIFDLRSGICQFVSTNGDKEGELESIKIWVARTEADLSNKADQNVTGNNISERNGEDSSESNKNN